ncbi:MAG: hypothetical protein Q4C95_08535 [Planctomycetia bacterium]|nr:hypothetical protein [Planctomycetia bacterium]
MFDSQINRFRNAWRTGVLTILFCFGLMTFSFQPSNSVDGSGLHQNDNPFADFDDSETDVETVDFDDFDDFNDSGFDDDSKSTSLPTESAKSSSESNKERFSKDDSEMMSPFASSEIKSESERSPITISQKNGVLVFEEEVKKKEVSEMTEEDFYKTLTSAEEIILTQKPKTAPELIEAAAMIARTGRPEFAKLLVEKSLTAPGTPEEFAQMIDRLGSNRILYLVANPMIGSQGAVAAELAMKEARKHWESPTFIQNGINLALSGNNPDRAAALIDLRKAGEVAIQRIFEMLLSEKADESEQAKTLFVFLGDSATEALLVALQTENTAQLAKIAQTLGTLQHVDIVPALLARYYDSKPLDDFAKSAIEEAFISQCSVIPSRNEAIEQLRQKTLTYFNRTQTLPQIEQTISLWDWDKESQKPIRQTFSEEAAYRFLTFRYAFQTIAIQENSESLDNEASNLEAFNKDFIMAMISAAEKIIYDSGLDSEPDLDAFLKLFPTVDALQLNAALEFALKTNHLKGGIIPVCLLAKWGDESLCYSLNKPSAVVQAATGPDRRLRYAALKTIAQWNPEKSYIGSSRVWDSLVQLTTASGTRKIIVAMPKIEDIMRVGNYFISQTPRDFSSLSPDKTGQNSSEATKSLLKEQDEKRIKLAEAKMPKQTPKLSDALTSYKDKLAQEQLANEVIPEFQLDLTVENGFVPSEDFLIIPAVTGNDIISIAQNNADVEFIVATSYIKTPDLRVVSQTLQKDYRTSDIPILIGYEEEVRSLWAHEYGVNEPNAIVLPFPYDSESGQWAVRKLYEKTNPQQVPVELRKQQSKWASQTLIQFLTSRYKLYQPTDLDILVRQMISSPFLFNEGLELAEFVATNQTQNYLMKLISENQFDLSVRRQILNSFRQNLQKNGSLLRGPDIIKMYDRYNASETEDQEVQQLLSDMLDAYEAVKK